LRFSTEIAVYLVNSTRYVYDYYGSLIGSHRESIDPSVPMTLSDLERRDARGKIFQTISVITLVPFGLGRPILARNTWGRISRGQPSPIPRERSPRAPKFFGPLHARTRHNCEPILYGDHTRRRVIIFTGSTIPWPKIFVT